MILRGFLELRDIDRKKSSRKVRTIFGHFQMESFL